MHMQLRLMALSPRLTKLLVGPEFIFFFFKKASEYDQEIPHSHTADEPIVQHYETEP